MNNLVTLSGFLLIIIITQIASQRLQNGGNGGHVSGREAFSNGVQTGQQHGNSLKAGSRNAEYQQAKLEKQERRQARIDKKSRRQERKKKRLAKQEASKLQAKQSTDFETFDNAEEFNNLEAAADKNIANKFGLSLTSENRHSENAAIKKNHGSKANSGTRLGQNEVIDAAQFVHVEAIDEVEFEDEDALSAADGSEDILNANEGSKYENNAYIDAQNQEQQFGNFYGDFNSGSGSQFNSDFFNGGRFGKRK